MPRVQCPTCTLYHYYNGTCVHIVTYLSQQIECMMVSKQRVTVRGAYGVTNEKVPSTRACMQVAYYAPLMTLSFTETVVPY